MKIDKPQKIALVGEREHGPARPELDRLTPGEWAARTPSLRAFPHPGPARDRLARVLAGLVPDLKRVRAFNLLTPHPVAGAWDPKKARAVAAALDLPGYDLVVFCGVRAAAAAGIPTPVGEDWGLPARTSLPGVRAATVVPHPSGLSRAWNDPALVDLLRGRLSGWGSGDGSGPGQPTAVGAYIFAGGFSLGVRGAGFRVLAHLEEGKFGTATARANWPDLPVHQDPGSWPLAGLEGVDLVYCNPPCSPWSTAGIVRGQSTERQVDWSSHSKAPCLDRCFGLLETLRPRFWCFESVRQVYTRAGGMLDHLAGRAAALGYSVDDLFVEASNHGVPQHRKRYFMVCRNLRVDWTPGEDRDPPAPLDLLAGADPEPRGRVPGSVAAVLPLTAQGENCRMAWDREVKAGRTPATPRPAFIYDRYREDRPSYTLLGSCTKVHPREDRMLSADECRALCGYPAHFRFLGSTADRYAQVGKGVCPPVAAWLAGNLRRALLDPAPDPVPVRRRVDVLRGRVETSDPVHLV